MTGISTKYKAFPDFILGITHEIWESRGVDLLNGYYSKDIPVRSPDGVVKGNQAVIRETMATLSEFPDRRLLGEDVIWDRTGPDSWYSSHRIMSLATHSGSGFYGTATGKQLRYRVIADCHAERNEATGWRINDEWLVRDRGAVVRQLDRFPFKEASSLNCSTDSRNSRELFRGGTKSDAGPYGGAGNDSAVGRHYAGLMQEIMGGGIRLVRQEYDRACQLEHPEGVTCHGYGPAEHFWIALRTSFPDAKFSIEHRLGIEEAGLPPRAALRWSLKGKHSGKGMFDGLGKDREVYVMGMSHAEFGPNGLRREFVLFDTLAIWQQILAVT